VSLEKGASGEMIVPPVPARDQERQYAGQYSLERGRERTVNNEVVTVVLADVVDDRCRPSGAWPCARMDVA
jgi:hypothetical protein